MLGGGHEGDGGVPCPGAMGEYVLRKTLSIPPTCSGATPPMWPTMTHSKRKNARKTSRRWKPFGWIKYYKCSFLQILQVCHINYEPLAYNETVEICRTPIVKVWNLADSWKFEQVWENYLFVNMCWIWSCLVVAAILTLKKSIHVIYVLFMFL